MPSGRCAGVSIGIVGMRQSIDEVTYELDQTLDHTIDLRVGLK